MLAGVCFGVRNRALNGYPASDLTHYDLTRRARGVVLPFAHPLPRAAERLRGRRLSGSWWCFPSSRFCSSAQPSIREIDPGRYGFPGGPSAASSAEIARRLRLFPVLRRAPRDPGIAAFLIHLCSSLSLTFEQPTRKVRLIITSRPNVVRSMNPTLWCRSSFSGKRRQAPSLGRLGVKF
jgi:hypothetical protein